MTWCTEIRWSIREVNVRTRVVFKLSGLLVVIDVNTGVVLKLSGLLRGIDITETGSGEGRERVVRQPAFL
jgi:hypothetical protein